MEETPDAHSRGNPKVVRKTPSLLSHHLTRPRVLDQPGKNDGNIPGPPLHSSPSSQTPRSRADVVGVDPLPSLPLTRNPGRSADHGRAWLLRCQLVCWHRHYCRQQVASVAPSPRLEIKRKGYRLGGSSWYGAPHSSDPQLQLLSRHSDLRR